MWAAIYATLFAAHISMGDFTWNLSSLSGVQWYLSQPDNASFTPIKASVPGQVHLDLMRVGLIPDPYYGFNDRTLRYVAESAWLYEAYFRLPKGACDAQMISSPITLIFLGLDTFAEVELNNRTLLISDNMYRAFNISIGPGGFSCQDRNKIKVLLKSATVEAEERARKYETEHASDWPLGVPPKNLPPSWQAFDRVQMSPGQIRKEPCSFGWDWGPGLATGGIWKDILLVTHTPGKGRRPLVIEDLLWTTTAPPVGERGSGGWRANVKMSFILPVGHDDKVSVRITLLDKSQMPVYKGEWSNVSIEELMPVSGSGLSFEVAGPVDMWWPNGYGQQNRYTLSVSAWLGGIGREENARRFTVGFKTIELVIDDDPDGRVSSGGGRSFYFKVNGVPIYIRGANWIPADAFESRIDEGRLRTHFQQYQKAHFNMLRVWGGGVYGSDLFYDLADEFGFLVWEEAMFAGGVYPTSTPGYLDSVIAEITQNLIRVYIESYRSLFFDTILNTSRELMPWLPAIPSSPWNGDETREHPIAENPNDEAKGDMHFYDYTHPNIFNLTVLPEPRFLSEFGFQSWSSLGQLKSVADDVMLEDSLFTSHPGSWPLHRQHLDGGNLHLQDHVEYLFGKQHGEGVASLKLRAAEAFLSQVVQGMWMKLIVEHCRRLQPYNMGLLYWQANDIWPTVSWSTLEYSGRPKIAMNMARTFYNLSEPTLFLNYSVDGVQFCAEAFDGKHEVTVFNLLTQKPANLSWHLEPREQRCIDLAALCKLGECVALSSSQNYLILGTMADFPISKITRFAAGHITVDEGYIEAEYATPFVELQCDDLCEVNHLLLIPGQPLWVGKDAKVVVGSLWSMLHWYRGGMTQTVLVSS
ncbi:hypothetical protein FOL47_011079 [Perkinsus chesapeaki]|uniref:beta-mannosidase n=1 Tax=Perkinsus chesapeaki TaxID=330153 RepID=A0A7J6L1B0_PERCH|nr:hypothetical protein FOL47_011079 [Perkinsus chesapeaki]